MNKNWLITLMLGIMLIGIASANLGEFRQGSIVNIRVLANCSTINITEVSTNGRTDIINLPMTNIGGQTFNFAYENTSITGVYSFSWNNPCVDCSTEGCGNTFTIAGIGAGDTKQFTETAFMIFIALVVVIFIWLKVSKFFGALMIMVIGLGILFQSTINGWIGWIVVACGLIAVIYSILK